MTRDRHEFTQAVCSKHTLPHNLATQEITNINPSTLKLLVFFPDMCIYFYRIRISLLPFHYIFFSPIFSGCDYPSPGGPSLSVIRRTSFNSAHLCVAFSAKRCCVKDESWKSQGVSPPGAHRLGCDAQPRLRTRIIRRALKIHPATPPPLTGYLTPWNRSLGINIFKAPRWFQRPVRVEISGSGDRAAPARYANSCSLWSPLAASWA